MFRCGPMTRGNYTTLTFTRRETTAIQSNGLRTACGEEETASVSPDGTRDDKAPWPCGFHHRRVTSKLGLLLQEASGNTAMILGRKSRPGPDGNCFEQLGFCATSIIDSHDLDEESWPSHDKIL